MHVEGAIQPPAGLPAAGALVAGKYRVERYIAEGGMGVIAVARHLELDEPVALKFLKADVVSADVSGTVASRFVREARATIKIRSEHVPRILDVTTLETGVPYIVMELLTGDDLDSRLEKQGPLPIALAIDLLLQALEALAAAHALGMVHRDFKPANLFVSKRLDGSACIKVLDFGIAKLVDRNGAGGDHGLTGTNAVMGSPRYMAPEQMRSTRDVDARADVWAVGTTLYELLTGAPPFNGETLTQVCAAILEDDPAPMTARRPDVPPALEAVVRQCLSKRPDGRPANVAELAAALAPFGTAPSAHDMAARVARVLGALVAESTPSLAVPASSLAPASKVPVAPGAGSSGIGMTNTSWGGADVSSQTRRRRVWAVAAGLAIVSIAGGAAFVSTRAPRGTALVSGGTGAPHHPKASDKTPIPKASEAVPNPTASTVVVATAESTTPPPSADEPATAEPTASAAPPSADSNGKSRPKLGDAKPAPTAAAKAAPAATSAPKAPPSSSAGAGGLWDDRK